MANTRSAVKRNRQAQRRRHRNVQVRSGIKSAVKKVREAVARGDSAQAKLALHQAARMLDKAASHGVLHAKNAARRISRLAHAVAKAGPAAT